MWSGISLTSILFFFANIPFRLVYKKSVPTTDHRSDIGVDGVDKVCSILTPLSSIYLINDPPDTPRP